MNYFVVKLNGDWSVLFQPADMPHQFLRIASFADRERAEDYAELEHMMATDEELGHRFDALTVKKVDMPSVLVSGLRKLLDAAKPFDEHHHNPPASEGGGAAAPDRVAAPRSLETKTDPELRQDRGEGAGCNDAIVASPPIQESGEPEPPDDASSSPPVGANSGEAKALDPTASPQPAKRGPPVTVREKNRAAILNVLRKADETQMSLGDLSRESGVPSGSVAPIMYDFEKEGIIKIRRSERYGEPNTYMLTKSKSVDPIEDALDKVMKDEVSAAQNRRGVKANGSAAAKPVSPPMQQPSPLKINEPIVKPSATEIPPTFAGARIDDGNGPIESPDGLLKLVGSYFLIDGGRKQAHLKGKEITIARALMKRYGQPVPRRELEALSPNAKDNCIMIRIKLQNHGFNVVDQGGAGFALMPAGGA